MAIKYHEKALKIAKSIGNRAGEATCCANLGNAYNGLGDFKKEIEYYLNAEKIFKELGQIHNLKTIYDNLYLAYEAIGDNVNAEKYKRMAGGG